MRVVIDTVRYETFAETVPVIGRVVARQASTVAARTRGPVEKANVHVGDRVKKGDVLISLVRDQLQAERDLRTAEFAEALAMVDVATANHQLAVQTMARLEGIRESAAFSRSRYEDQQQEVMRSDAALAQARARLSAAQAALDLAELNLGYALIRAPFSGVVAQRQIAAGSYVEIGQTVATLINDSDLEIEANVPSDRITDLSAASDVSVQINDQPLALKVRAIVPEEIEGTRTRPVRFSPQFDIANSNLAVNQSVVVRLPSGTGRPLLTVHKDAVINRQGGNFVFVANNETAEIRPVRLGAAVESRFEVLGGVEEGEKVVIRGNERLIPGQPIVLPEES